MEIKSVSGVSIVPVKKANRERMGGDKEGKEKEGGEQRRGREGVSVGIGGGGWGEGR